MTHSARYYRPRTRTRYVHTTSVLEHQLPGAPKECAWVDCTETAIEQCGVNICQPHAELIAKELVLVGVIPRWRKVNDDTPGSVYFVLVGDLIKIGWSSKPRQRLHQYPPDSTLLAIYRGTKKDEKQQHQDMSAFRAKGREWYRDHPEVRQRIAEICQAHGTPTWSPWKQAKPNGHVSLRARSGPTGSYVR